MAEQVFVAHPVGRDRFQSAQEIIGFHMLPRDLLQRILAEQVVVAVVAVRRRPFRRILQPRLIKLVEQFVLLRHAIGYRRDLRKGRAGQRENKATKNFPHRPTVAECVRDARAELPSRGEPRSGSYTSPPATTVSITSRTGFRRQTTSSGKRNQRPGKWKTRSSWGKTRAFQSAAQPKFHQGTTQDRDQKDPEIHFARSIDRDAPNYAANSFLSCRTAGAICGRLVFPKPRINPCCRTLPKYNPDNADNQSDSFAAFAAIFASFCKRRSTTARCSPASSPSMVARSPNCC